MFRIIIYVMRLVATFSELHRLALSVSRLDHGRKNVYWIYDGIVEEDEEYEFRALTTTTRC